MSSNPDDHIAVIGMACRFPGARDYRQYWRNLAAGVESLTHLTDDELRAQGVAEWKIEHPNWVKAVPLVDDVESFDAQLFGFTAREAEIRDPQSRLFLETCYAALEDGGYDTERYPGSVGVFAGTGENEYRDNVRRNSEAWNAAGHTAVEISNGAGFLTTTVSHRLSLRGPSVSVQTACSTSLVAVHLASQTLRAGECDLALAGAVEVPLSLRHGYLRTASGLTSHDGHCRAFDAEASGTVFGTGVGMVLLKRLPDALADNDHIYAVIRGSAVNNDGAQRPGYTAPSTDRQADLVTSALAAAEVTPDTIGYIEAHGTGTPLGDPVEITALTRAFRAGGDRSRGRCRVGSAKPNIGHLAAAAGVAGLIKVCLAFQQEAIPPSINFERPNPRIDFEGSPFVVNTALTSWPRGATLRRAGISSFGIGGTNAHVVVDEPPRQEHRVTSRRRLVLPVSAKTETALETATQRLADNLATDGDRDHARVAYTLQVGRRQLPYRRAVVAGANRDAGRALAAVRGGDVSPARPRTVVYLFPGQGAQHPGMGQGLYETEPIFRDAVDRCAELLSAPLGLDLRSILFPSDEQRERVANWLRQTRLAQPALFTVEYALAETLRSWGIRPAAMIGHSVGEWVAAHLAGVFSLPDALALVAERGRLMQSMPEGAMLSVSLPAEQLADMLPEELEIATVNAPDLTVVAGPTVAVDQLRSRLERLAVPATTLHTSHAFHSRSMEPILAEFGEAVAGVQRSAPQARIVSNVTGTWVTPAQATDPAYWTRQLREPVQFAQGVRTLAELADPLLLEVGPGRSLGELARRTLDDADMPVIATMRGARQPTEDDLALAQAVAELWVAGVSLDWHGYWGDLPPGRTPLPEYPFERRRYWIDPDDEPGTGLEHPTDGARQDVDDVPAPLPIERSMFSVCWRERSLAPDGVAPVAPRWLLLSSGSPVLESLRDQLAAAGARVSMAVPGPEFREIDEDRFTVRPAQREDLAQLVTAVSTSGGLPTHIVHGFALTEAVPDPLDPAAVAAAADHGFYSLLHLAQEIAKHHHHRSHGTVQLFAVSSNLQDVTGGEELEPAKAMVIGPSLLASRELPGVRCRSIDFALPARLAPTAPAAEILAGQLLAEVRHEGGPSQVAWRGRKRWVWDHETVPLTAPAGVPVALRQRGVYLIPGGLGGIGLIVAAELARLVQARLVLLGRSPLPARAEWPQAIADPDTPAGLRERLERLQEIEAAGGELMIRTCDVADEQQLAAVVEEAIDRFGAVHGVFHSAAVAGGGMLAFRSRAQAEQVLAPKVAGTLALHRVLGGRADFIVLFSSYTAVRGDFGLVDYVAANNFQDAFARRAAGRGEPVYSIGWALWRGGMGATLHDPFPTLLRDLQRGERSEPAAHPLLDRRVHSDGADAADVVYSTVLEPGSHWILTDHLIGDVQVVPGTALVEMVRAGYAEAFGGPVELRDVVFLGPIAVTGPIELRLHLRPDGDEYDVTVVVNRADHAGRVHVKARARPGVGDATTTHDLAALAGRCDRETITIPLAPDGLVRFGEHWHSVRTVRVGDREELARVELAERFWPECKEYVLHPGLFDDAVSNTQVLPAPVAGEGGFLPLSYGRIVVHGPLPPAFTVHVRHRDTPEGEISSDIVLIDDDGAELVRVDQYVCRRIPAESVRANLDGANGEQLPIVAGGAPAPEGPDWFLDESSGLDALRRILHHLPKPHLIVSPEGLDLRRLERLTGERLEQQVAATQLPAPPAGRQAATDERLVDTPYVAPENELQQVLANLLQNTLGVALVGIDDDFFELGGNSLAAVQLGFRLRELLEIDVPVASLLEQPTVRGVAAALDHLLREDAVVAPTDDPAKQR